MADNPHFTTEQLTDRWEDRRDIKNLMGKYSASLLLKREKTMFADFWSQREDISFGVNKGYYSGREAIDNYFKIIDRYTSATRDLLIKLFPEETAGKTPDELYGIGPFECKAINNAVIEIAADGLTAKGMWHCLGMVTDVTTRGPVSHWIMATFAADFVREDDGWKLWHLLYLEDVNCPAGQSWADKTNPYPELPEFAPLASVPLPQPNVSRTLRERYYPDRPFTRLPLIPETYDTFTDTFSYGPEGGQ
jgi:hypothetical protein